ncbi:sugar O-acyltransferase, sialic acid O-acetyltransferase NeuD family [Paucidesulfovibrio gracilis DSM 16080]|uniref:Sugar O-acyltransferase, sialic acid O-acetyltransferase NeuD family n=1 Tax=Paucidesulfovibrio gracilis DSM 16080 TaxID=1121449 RepID=A0A1T4XXQ6_9BACT|nr:acetyltransferase [Paucidesulfovibrio gracilis]SKA94362.1 sugar O-acyltransferase, sialic acid O-acetyltransferase NeuD family [Paucidesulfovibrio gracilis DSM 16080]
MKVVIIGAGGHGQVVADILFHMWTKGRDLELVGFVDDDPEREGTSVLGLKVLGPVNKLDHIGHEAVIVALDDNRARLEMTERLDDERMINAIHPSAVLAPDVSVKPGGVVCAGAVINPGTIMERGAIVNTGAIVDHNCTLNEFSHVGPGVNLGEGVHVGQGTLIGLGASLIPKLRLGNWSVVGAGAVTTRDVPDSETWVGVPARKLS